MLAVALVFGTHAVLPRDASAGAFYISDIGTRALARGGAYVAAPDSLLALHYNPAALSLLSGLHFEADLSIVALDFTFERKCPCVDPALNSDAATIDAALEAEFDAHPAKTSSLHRIPYLAIGYGFPVYDLTVAFAAYGPNAGKYEFGLLPPASSVAFERAARNSPSRYTGLDADTLEVNFALGFGMQPIEGLRVGGSVIIYQNANDQHLHLWLNSATFASQPEQTGFDVPIFLSFRRNFALNWSLGASVEPVEGLTIGASFRGKRSVRSDGTIIIDKPMLLTDVGADVTGQDIEIEVNTPPIARAGVQYEMPRVFKAEAAFVYEHWSSYRNVVIHPKNIQVTIGGNSTPLGRIEQPKGWKDTYSIRVGGEVNLFEPYVGLRAGYFFEPSAIPPETLDPSRVDAAKHGFGLGASTTWYGISLELGFMFIALNTVDVTNSQVKITAPLDPPLGSPQYVTTIGNGTYSASYVIGSASLSFALDPLLRL